MRFLGLVAGLFAVTSLVGCSPSTSQLTKKLEENPEILLNAIKKNPKAFMETVQEAAQLAQRKQMQDRQKQAEQALEKDFDNPVEPKISDDRAVFGNKDAPITIVEYSDFQCPFCARGADTMDKLFEKYPDKLKLVYKHLPFKSNAEPAARYFEAIAMQDVSKAKKFHDILFENQRKLKKGEDYLQEAAKKVGADMAKVKELKDSDKVSQRIESDLKEASEFGFTGTPGFVVNGVRVKGAYPAEHFTKIIDRHLGKDTDQKKN